MLARMQRGRVDVSVVNIWVDIIRLWKLSLIKHGFNGSGKVHKKKWWKMEVVLRSASRLVGNRLLDMLRKPVSPSIVVPQPPFDPLRHPPRLRHCINFKLMDLLKWYHKMASPIKFDHNK